MFNRLNEACGFKKENIIKLCIISFVVGVISLFSVYFIFSTKTDEIQEIYDTAYSAKYDETIKLDFKEEYDRGYDDGYKLGHENKSLEEIVSDGGIEGELGEGITDATEEGNGSTQDS